MKSITEVYYNSISDSLQNEKELYYNGALIVDLDSNPKTFVEQDITNIIKLSGVKRESKILECGCGSGYFFKKLILKYPNIDYVGIDLSENQICNAKRLNQNYPSKFQKCNWNTLDFGDNIFDNVLFLETIGYADNIDRLLSECFRVLKTGGVLFSKHPGCLDEKYFHLSETDQKIKALNNEYGYSEKSLGMMMNVSYFEKKLVEHGFNISYGPVVPPRDESLYIKTHFIEKVHKCFETIKVNNSYISCRYPDADESKFLHEIKKIDSSFNQQNILSDLGKKHPILVDFFRNKSLIEKNINEKHNLGHNIMSPCVLVSAIKP